MDFNKEYGELLIFIGNVATTIRMNSKSYNHSLLEGEKVINDRIMYFSDALHNLTDLGNSIISNDPLSIIDSCDNLIQQFTTYKKETSIFDNQTNLPYKLFSLDEAIKIFNDIKEKCKQTHNV